MAGYGLKICEASPPSRAGLPGEEDCHFCIAPLDPALPDGACGEQAGQSYRVCVQGESTGGYDPMGFSLRIFLVWAGDSVWRFPVTFWIMGKDGRSP